MRSAIFKKIEMPQKRKKNGIYNCINQYKSSKLIAIISNK